MNLIPISRSLKAALAGLIAATSVLGTLTLQTALYRSITGIAVPAHDNYFYAIVLFLEDVVSLCITLRASQRGVQVWFWKHMWRWVDTGSMSTKVTRPNDRASYIGVL